MFCEKFGFEIQFICGIPIFMEFVITGKAQKRNLVHIVVRQPRFIFALKNLIVILFEKFSLHSL